MKTDNVISPNSKENSWDLIWSNPIRVDLSKAVFPKRGDGDGDDDEEWYDNREGEWSGRIVYDLKWIDDGEGDVSFFCGPEAVDGSLEDTLDGGATQPLEALFSDMDIMVQDSENVHTVTIPKGVKGKDLWAVIEARLKKSGVVKMGSR